MYVSLLDILTTAQCASLSFPPSFPLLFLLSLLPVTPIFPCDLQTFIYHFYFAPPSLSFSRITTAITSTLISFLNVPKTFGVYMHAFISLSALSNTLVLLSLLFLLCIDTGRIDDIPVAEYKYTPSLSTSSFSKYILSARTLLFPSLFSPFPYSSICTTLTPFPLPLPPFSPFLPLSNLTSLPLYHLPSPLPLLHPTSPSPPAGR